MLINTGGNFELYSIDTMGIALHMSVRCTTHCINGVKYRSADSSSHESKKMQALRT